MNFEREKVSCMVCGSSYIEGVAGIFRCPRCNLLFSGQKAGFGNAIQGLANHL
jgi:ribosomal protein L37AE/L43A